MYSTETYIIILWRCPPLYDYVRHWLAKTVNSAFKFDLTFAVKILHMDPDTFYFNFYNMNFNTHALEKIYAYFYMAHPYDCN
jgi:hypothetical protein